MVLEGGTPSKKEAENVRMGWKFEPWKERLAEIQRSSEAMFNQRGFRAHQSRINHSLR